MKQAGLASIESAIAELKAGRPVVVVDDEGRENEGDFIMAAEHADPAWLGFIIRYSSGIVCVAMEPARADALGLPPMVATNTDPRKTAYTVTVDAADGITTGVSGADRAHTINLLANPSSQPSHFNRPGHILPLRAREQGVLERPGHTEATVDLCRIAGCEPVGLLAEVMTDEGEMMRLPQLVFFALQHGLKVISIADLIAYRLRVEANEIGGVERAS